PLVGCAELVSPWVAPPGKPPPGITSKITPAKTSVNQNPLSGCEIREREAHRVAEGGGGEDPVGRRLRLPRAVARHEHPRAAEAGRGGDLARAVADVPGAGEVQPVLPLRAQVEADVRLAAFAG